MQSTATSLEENRLKVLRNHHINKGKEDAYDELTALAAKLTEVPRALISIVDKETVWFKSQYGVQLKEGPRQLSFCNDTLESKQDIYIVEDARKVEHLQDHPYVNAADPVIFYAGIPLKNEDGVAIGTLCVFDNIPHKLDDEKKKSLQMVADLTMSRFSLKQKNELLKEKTAVLKQNNEMLSEFAHLVSHDMKMPLANVVMTSDLIVEKYSGALDKKGKDYLHYIKDAAFSLRDYIDNILQHYESEHLVTEDTEEVDIYELLEDVEDLTRTDHNINYVFPENNETIVANKAVLEQILLNLTANAIKYNTSDPIVIEYSFSQDDKFYYIGVKDNGMGIPESEQHKIFNLFATLNTTDRNGKTEHGIGLSTVKNLVTKLGGLINLESEEGKGSKFTFSVLK